MTLKRTRKSRSWIRGTGKWVKVKSKATLYEEPLNTRRKRENCGLGERVKPEVAQQGKGRVEHPLVHHFGLASTSDSCAAAPLLLSWCYWVTDVLKEIQEWRQNEIFQKRDEPPKILQTKSVLDKLCNGTAFACLFFYGEKGQILGRRVKIPLNFYLLINFIIRYIVGIFINSLLQNLLSISYF